MDLIDRQALLKQIDIDSDGEPGYYGDTWKFIDTIKSMPPAELGTNLAEVGTDCISRDDVLRIVDYYGQWNDCHGREREAIEQLPPIQPERKECEEREQGECRGMQDDAINRQQAIRWVKTECNPYGKPTLDFESGKKVIEHLEQMPPAQPEIIRCRNCKFASGDSRICMKFGHSPIGELDFCAWAERRADE